MEQRVFTLDDWDHGEAVAHLEAAPYLDRFHGVLLASADASLIGTAAAALWDAVSCPVALSSSDAVARFLAAPIPEIRGAVLFVGHIERPSTPVLRALKFACPLGVSVVGYMDPDHWVWSRPELCEQQGAAVPERFPYVLDADRRAAW